MWNNKIRVFIVFAALVTLNKAQRNNEYLPPSNAYLPAPDDPVNIGDANSDSSVFLKPDIQDDSETQVVVDNHDHGHDHDHDHHHEHWDLRESIPGEPGQDYPLHYSVPETGFSCAGRTAGYYADIEAGCQAFHVCPEDAALATQSFLCPNGSIFNQEVFACDWWNNVDCAGSETHYVRNNEIGVYNPSNSNKVPVRLKPENRRPQEQEVDINFQPQSSNEDSRQYLPPVADNRKPIVTEYNGPPPTRAPVTIARTQPTRPATQRVQPTVARTQATTTYRPVTTERNYLPPVVEQEIYRPVVQQQVQRVTQRPVQRVPQPIPSTTRRPVNIENIYIPPAPTPSRNVVQQTFIQQTSQRIQSVTTPRPVTQQAYSRPSSQQFIQSTARPYQAPVAVTTSRPFQPIRVAEPAGNNFNFEGYNYDKPSVDLQTPVLESRPVSNQNYLPPQTVNIVSTQRPIPTYTTTPRPVTVSQTFAPIRQTPAPQNQRPSFSQTEGYNYPRPAVGLPAPSSTRAPVQQTRAPVRPTPAPFSQTQAPFRQTFAPVVQTQAPFRQTPAPQNQRPSFSQTEGYNYPKPSVGLPAPSSIRAPVTQAPFRQTFAPVTQTQAPIRQTYAPVTQAPIRQTFAPVTQTQPPIRQTFAPVRQTPAPQNQRPSFSQNEGYNYPRPAVGLPAPSSTRAPVQQTRAPVRPTPAPFSQTQAPFRQTFAPVVQTQAPFRQTPAPQNQRPSFSQTEGYNYPKPSVGLPAPSSTRAPVTQAPFRQTFAPVTQAPIRQTYAPVTQAPIRQTFAPVTQTQAPIRQTFTAIQQTSAPQNQRPSFSQNEGYNYPRPAVGLPDPGSTRAPVTQAPIRQTFAPVQQTQAPIRQTFAPVSQTFAPVRQTFAPVTQTFAPVRQTPVQQSQRPAFSQTEGYNYPKPAVGLPALSNTRAPVQQTFAPVPQTQAPIRQTFAPVIQTFAPVRQTPAPQNQKPSFSQNEGYNYPKPAVGLPAPSSTDAPVRQTFSQVTQTATPVRQTFAPIIQTTQRPVVSTTRQPAIPTQAFDKDEGYSYRKPALAFELPSSINKAVSTNTQQTSYQQSFQLSSQQVGNAQATFNSENGYSNTKVATSQTNKPAGFNRATVSVQTISTTLRPQITKDDHSIAVQQNYQVLSVKNQNIQQASQQNNQGYQYNLPAAAKAHPAPFSVKNSQTASYVAPSPQPNFAPAVQYQQDITSQQHTTCIHAQNAQSASLSSGVSQEYLPPVGSQSDISQISQQINNDFEGYNYPKPKTPFITPNNPTLQVSSSSFQSSPQGNQFGQASYQRQNSRNLGAESFIQGFNAASGNFHNNQQGVLNTQQSYQQHNSDQGSQSFSGARATSTSDSAQHHFDIVPSISFSYQLDPEAKNAKASHMSY